MNEIYVFNPEIYPRMLWVAVGVSEKELNHNFVNAQPMGYDSKGEVQKVIRRIGRKIGYLVQYRCTEEMDIEAIAHEANHVASNIFDDIGAGRDKGQNKEPFAYLCGWVSKCIEEAKQCCIELDKMKNGKTEDLRV